MYGKKKRYIKVYFTVDVRTREVVVMDVTTDDTYDSEALPSLIINAQGVS
jgi:hypothetical protein